VETLPETVQQQVREGKIGAQIAMRFLVPVARVSLEQCLRMAAIFAQQHWTTRQAAALYNAWRNAKGAVRQRILANPELFLKTQQQPAPATLDSELNKIIAITQRALQQAESPPPDIAQMLRKIQHATTLLNELAEKIEEHKDTHAESGATRDDSGTACSGDQQARDRAPAEPLASQRAQGSASQLQRRAEDRTGRESHALPATDSGTVGQLQRQPRASP
jgi:hypothetical protein